MGERAVISENGRARACSLFVLVSCSLAVEKTCVLPTTSVINNTVIKNSEGRVFLFLLWRLKKHCPMSGSRVGFLHRKEQAGILLEMWLPALFLFPSIMSRSSQVQERTRARFWQLTMALCPHLVSPNRLVLRKHCRRWSQAITPLTSLGSVHWHLLQQARVQRTMKMWNNVWNEAQRKTHGSQKHRSCRPSW